MRKILGFAFYFALVALALPAHAIMYGITPEMSHLIFGGPNGAFQTELMRILNLKPRLCAAVFVRSPFGPVQVSRNLLASAQNRVQVGATVEVAAKPTAPIATRRVLDERISHLKSKISYIEDPKYRERNRTYVQLDDVLGPPQPGVYREIFPVQSLGRTGKSFTGGRYVPEDFSYFRTLEITTENHPSGEFQVRTYRPRILRGEPYGFVGALVNEMLSNPREPRMKSVRLYSHEELRRFWTRPDLQSQLPSHLKPDASHFTRAENQMVSQGARRQIEILKKLLVFTFVHYERRGWNKGVEGEAPLSTDPVELERMITQVIDGFPQYQNQIKKAPESVPLYISMIVKAIETLPTTTYHEVFRVGADGKEEVLGLIGETVAPYGTVTFQNLATNQWETRYGMFGSRFNEFFYSPEAVSTHSDLPFDRGRGPSTGLAFHWSLVDNKVPALPAEVTFENRPLERPWVQDAVMPNYQGFKSAEDQFEMTGPFPKGVDPNLNAPIQFGVGEAVEPVKFVVKKVSPLRLRVAVNKALMLKLMEHLLSRSPKNDYDQAEFNMKGRRIFTFNPEKEVDLYIQKSFELVPDDPAVIVNGQLWVRLGATMPAFTKWLMSLDDERSATMFSILYEQNEAQMWSGHPTLPTSRQNR